MVNSPAATLLWREIERTSAYRRSQGADLRLAPTISLLSAWQSERLARTYADLRADPRHQPATEFFLNDLYQIAVSDRITEADYCEAYRRCDNCAGRKHQIELICELGRELDAVVAKPMIYAALRLARRPAQLAGLHELQDFLERGFSAYRHMKGAKEFLDTIEARESRILDRIYARDPRPFRLDRR